MYCAALQNAKTEEMKKREAFAHFLVHIWALGGGSENFNSLNLMQLSEKPFNACGKKEIVERINQKKYIIKNLFIQE